MAYFAVTRERGPGWRDGVALREQDGWNEHAVFMDELAAEGFVVLGGPLTGTATVLLAVEAPSAEAVEQRLASDPWSGAGILRLDRVTPWQVLLRAPTV